MASEDTRSRTQRWADWDVDEKLRLSERVRTFATDQWQKVRRNKQAQRWLIGVIVVASILLVTLFVTGQLGRAYRAVFEAFPGRQWTYVMRDYPWVYAILAAVLIIIPLSVFGLRKWRVVILAYVVFLVGFLGGHVFWGDAGPGYTHCFNSAFEARVDPHNKVVAAEAGSETGEAIAFFVSVTPRENQPRSAFAVDANALVAAVEGPAAGIVVDQLWIEDDPYVWAVIMRPASGASLPEGEFSGQVLVTDKETDTTCELKRPYRIQVGA